MSYDYCSFRAISVISGTNTFQWVEFIYRWLEMLLLTIMIQSCKKKLHYFFMSDSIILVLWVTKIVFWNDST